MNNPFSEVTYPVDGGYEHLRATLVDGVPSYEWKRVAADGVLQFSGTETDLMDYLYTVCPPADTEEDEEEERYPDLRAQYSALRFVNDFVIPRTTKDENAESVFIASLGTPGSKYRAWMDKTLRINEGKTLTRGMRVVDFQNKTGIVVNIVPGVNTEDHGGIHVWRDTEDEYGADNCEHYVEFGWRAHLRILESP